MGALSRPDRATPLLFACTILMLLTAYPAMLWLSASPLFEIASGRTLAVFHLRSYNGLWLCF